jgi:glycosyltransferase involved in cell wall biosynthesis
MFEDKKVAVVVPAHNEGTQIATVIETMPDTIDKIVIVDDCSTDNTVEVVKNLMSDHPRVHLILHEKNQGVGGAIVSGYEYARNEAYDIAVVMAGDAQMDPNDLPAIVGPVARDEVDYCKGNRLFTGEAFHKIPAIRYFGNAVLSLMTKVASGYWHVADSQTGYTAINLKMLRLIDWQLTYRRYGCPNDYLVRLNIYNARVRDVPIEPVYNVGERSGIRLHRVIPRMLVLLTRLFFTRMIQKYIIRDFHPLVLFYSAGFATLFAFIVFFVRMMAFYIPDFIHRPGVADIPDINALACGFLFISAVQFFLFAMFFDMESNKDLR